MSAATALILADPVITLNSVDLSDSIDEVEISYSWAAEDVSGFGDAAARPRRGKGDHSVRLSLVQDLTAGKIDATIASLIAAAAKPGECSFAVRADDDDVSATNPQWSGTLLITAYSPLSGTLYSGSRQSVTWPVIGDIARATSS